MVNQQLFLPENGKTPHRILEELNVFPAKTAIRIFHHKVIITWVGNLLKFESSLTKVCYLNWNELNHTLMIFQMQREKLFRTYYRIF